MTPQIHEAFHRYLDNWTWDGFFDVEGAQKVSIIMEQAFVAGAYYGAKAEREECAAHIASREVLFLDLKTHAVTKGTKRCCQCMMDNLKELAKEIREGKTQKRKEKP